jgi:hypothetical protein
VHGRWSAVRLLYAVEDDPGLDALRELAETDGGEVEEHPEWDRLVREARRGDTVYTTLRAVALLYGEKVDLMALFDGLAGHGIMLRVLDDDQGDVYTTTKKARAS